MIALQDDPIEAASEAGPRAAIISMLELRVLSGLSRGAALPIEQDPVRIGPDASADLVLVDAGLASPAVLECDAEGRFTLSVQRDGLEAETPPRLLAEGEIFELGRIRLQVSSTDAPWDFELPVRAAADPTGPTARPEAAAAPGPRPLSKVLRIGLPVALLALVLAVGGVMWSGRHAAPRKPAPVRVVSAPVGHDQLEALAQALRGLLRDAGLSEVVVAVGADQLVLDGSVLPDKQESFERLVTRFRREHRPVRLQLRMTGGSAVPGFVVRVLVGGDLRVAVLDDGRQLSVGMVEEGWRLLDVTGACALFVEERSSERARICLDRPQKQ